MTLFRLFLAAWLVVIVAYTSVTVANHGLDLLPVFFGDMAEMGWPGQFNLDFMGFLALSALWVAWRHQFSPAGLGLGPGRGGLRPGAGGIRPAGQEIPAAPG